MTTDDKRLNDEVKRITMKPKYDRLSLGINEVLKSVDDLSKHSEKFTAALDEGNYEGIDPLRSKPGYFKKLKCAFLFEIIQLLLDHGKISKSMSERYIKSLEMKLKHE